MKRFYYGSSVSDFAAKDKNAILGEIVHNNQFSLDDLQRNTWETEITVLKRELAAFVGGYLLFEYTIPRIGDRIDNVLLYKGIVFLLEFKVGSRNYGRDAINQVTDYALDLKYFHKESSDKFLVPILVATEAPAQNVDDKFLQDDLKIFSPICCNAENIASAISFVTTNYNAEPFPPETWIKSLYMPTPTIVEAARALYNGHHVEEITRNDADAINLGQTTKAINRIIDAAKAKKEKTICFVTGVPGAGKTLAGLNISIEYNATGNTQDAVFLSGNGPLVDVLQEALSRDDRKHNGTNKSQALRKTKDFIQIIHHFRDEAIITENAPSEKIAIFDEAQRAWTEPMLADFMNRKKHIQNFNMSEPEFLISIMDRHKDWTVIICLIGGGQEINTGEAGLSEWFNALRKKYPNWKVCVSDKITDTEYSNGLSVQELLKGMNYEIVRELHLAVSLRSFRSEKVSAFVKAMLDVDIETAKRLYADFREVYPVVMTRKIETAKSWVKDRAKGTQRYGMTASSGARRLRTYGVWVEDKVDAPNWFLNDEADVRSSFYLEETATEFDIQGLELDWTIVCWDANLRFNGNIFEFFNFRGTKWEKVHQRERIAYLKNAYRVLLTRARQGFVIFIPEGNDSDATRLREFYDGTYKYLQEIGIEEI